MWKMKLSEVKEVTNEPVFVLTGVRSRTNSTPLSSYSSETEWEKKWVSYCETEAAAGRGTWN